MQHRTTGTPVVVSITKPQYDNNLHIMCATTRGGGTTQQGSLLTNAVLYVPQGCSSNCQLHERQTITTHDHWSSCLLSILLYTIECTRISTIYDHEQCHTSLNHEVQDQLGIYFYNLNRVSLIISLQTNCFSIRLMITLLLAYGTVITNTMALN